jgi:hypothetical protein
MRKEMRMFEDGDKLWGGGHLRILRKSDSSTSDKCDDIGNALKSSILMGGRPLYIWVRGPYPPDHLT